ncbi:MAG: glycosyl hydrolase 115 family protein [Bryobacteraceae bacterium]|jgi:hypothetical protein
MGKFPLVCLLALPCGLYGLGQVSYVETAARPGSFPITQGKTCASLYVDPADYAGVIRAAADLQADIERVTGCKPAITHDAGTVGHVIVIGSLEKSPLVTRLVDTTSIAGKWEAFLTQVVGQKLVVAGSDKRGTIYGIYDLSEQIGVSPWYWWADVPVAHKDALFVRPGRFVQGEPAIRYRGIFLNDEAPSLSGWSREKFGGWNSKFYVEVFELILRLKGNYLWPAMWGSAFNEDDPLNPQLADEYGIVMGTSHHEPMLRAQQEWKRHGIGPWNYATNPEVLRAFWDEGIARNKAYESIVTLAMRGDGDMPMTGNTDIKANMELLERIVADQRAILSKYFGPDLSKVPQDWALYKEVQEYYEAGMRVPDDVTLLWCDDNWGNIRRLPTAEERKRGGGAGIYYHFDYVGGPRNYKWLNTNPITKVWEQMNLAYEYDARRIWIVNVGDLKPMEFPIEYFLSLAWNPKRWPHDKIAEFGRMWATREFGPEHAADIADIVAKYTKYNGRRKPELLEPGTFSLENYDEADTALADWKAITEKAERIYKVLPAVAKDAFFELVLYPTKACEIVNELYIAAARNHLYAQQGRASTNDYAARVRGLFQADADWSATYNHALAGGKWDHMMDQTHIGYTGWQQPDKNNMPAAATIEVPEAANMGVEPAALQLDSFNQPRRHIDIYNRGRAPFAFTASVSAPWIVLSQARGTIEKDERLWVTVDWTKVPNGAAEGAITIAGAAHQATVKIATTNPRDLTRESLRGFVETDGYVSIEAPHYSRKTDAAAAHWERIDDYGRTLSAMTILPVTAPSATLENGTPGLEYRMYLFNPGTVTVHTIIAPTLNFVPGRGLRFAVAFDDQAPQIVDALAHNSLRDWEESVKDNVRDIRSTHGLKGPGYHILKYWMVDPGVVLQKMIVDLGGLKPSYLGPPESYHKGTL